MKLRPKILTEINKAQLDIFRPRSPRLNLSFNSHKNRKETKFLWAKWLVTIVVICSISLLGLATAPTGASSPSTLEERQALEAKLQEIEGQIAEYEKTIDVYRRQGRTLRGEVNRLDAQVAKINLQIRSINLTLVSLGEEIKITGDRIEEIESEIDVTKTVIARALQDIYESENQNLLQIFLQNPKLSDFFGNLNNLFLLQENLQVGLKRGVALREDVLNQKEQLALKKSDAVNLKIYQESQGRQIRSLKQEKDSLLRTTRGREEIYQKLLTETKKTAVEIRSRLFELLGGGAMTFEQAYELAKHAEQLTGTRVALILAVLDRESALGRNVGQCNYRTAMHPTRDIPVFLEIIHELGLTANLELGLIKVSCPIIADGAYGGAMGPAQFIPSTWNMYKDQISRLTGNRPPSPWRNIDAFVATGLYLRDAYNSSACVQYGRQIPGRERLLRERCAAAQYYAGRRWHAFRWAYGEPVVQRANKFQQDIDMMREDS